jgi:DNA-binding NarL/FixJ family response regulator
MRNCIDIDYSHSRAIVQEIGERLQASLKEDRELPASLRMQIDRLRQSEAPSQPNVAEPTPHWWTRARRTRR